MRAKQLMTAHPHVLSETDSIADAMALASDHGVRHLPIVRDGKPIGVISDRDLRRVEGLLAADVDRRGLADKLLAGRAMSLLEGEPVTIPLEATAKEVVDAMLEAHVGSLLVVDAHGALAGIVSYVDVLRALGSKL